MFRLLPHYIISSIIVLSGLYLARASDNLQFTDSLFFAPLEYSSQPGITVKGEANSLSENESPLQYREGDWYKYIIEPSYKREADEIEKLNIYSKGDVNINTFGSAKLDLKYGKSMFTRSRYKQYDEDTPFSRVISSGFTPEQVVLLHMEGEVGERITVYIDHDSRRKDNRYLMQYRAVEDDEVVREINTGEIDIEFNHSRYAVYDNRGVKGLGADFTLAKSGLRIKGFASVSRGETEVEYFRGNSSPGGVKISEYQYLKRTYYQLEPFIRYDGVTSTPLPGEVDDLIAVTSEPDEPGTYSPYQVNIIPSGFELYMDDQNPYNNQGAITLPFDGGFYTRLINGTDYSINYTTGVIKFLRNIPESARIFAAYTIDGGTKDLFVIAPGDADHPGGAFSGKNIAFIKYGYSLSGIGKRDVYEIRSYFFIGARNILPTGFSLTFFRENSKMTDAEVRELSRYSIDRGNGIILFSTREPFRRLFTDTSAADRIYSEVQPPDVYISSRYRIGADYNVEARSFQLKHFNLIENSVKVKVNGKEISSSLYTVDYYSGFLIFSDSNNPLITADTNIEIKYEYLPFGSSDSSFMGGLRADYDLTRDIRIGGTVLISRGAESEVVPDVGSESDQTVVLEGDASLNLGQKRLADLYNAVTGSRVSSIPLEVKAYGEVAKSIRNTNIFGKALIDNMESTDEIVSVSLSEKEWQLSSMPDGQDQDNRGIMNYFFYRDPWSPETLKGPGFTPYAVPYSVKPGPYNIAMGHIDNSIVEQSSQRSLVFDFDFTDGNYVSVVTRKLSEEAVDMSGLQYVEVWVKYDGSEADGVDLFVDLGVIDEDSDGDGFLDTEDRNRNGFIDSNPSSGYSEDRGYTFNGNNPTVVGSGPGLSSYTLGDGVLNTEDLNGNGILDTDENVCKIELGSVGRNGGNWQRIRIPVNISALTDDQINALKQVISARLYLNRKSDVTGRLYISSLKFVASKWKNPERDDGTIAVPDDIKVTRINSISDDEYRAESFMLLQRGVFESLYGSRSSDDLKSESESALQIDYKIPAGNTSVSITRSFATPFDIRNYKTMNVWVNPRIMNLADSIGIVIGSSEYDYVEYRSTPANLRTWRNLKLKLKSGSGGNVDLSSSAGNTDFRRIKYLKIIVYGAPGSAGEIWLNDIYLSEPETLTGKAQWYEGEAAFKRPVYVTESGVPVFSDMRVKYLYRGNSANFSSPAKGDDEIDESAYELSSSFKILPHWSTAIDYTKEESRSDSRDENIPYDSRGDTEREQILFTTAYRSPGEGGPSINISYGIDRHNNLKDRNLDSQIYTEESSRVVHTPVISIDQRFADFLDGTLTAKMLLNMAFSAISLNRYSDTISDETLQQQYGGDERDRRQRSELLVQLNYTGKYFFLRPKLAIMSEEIVDIQGERRSEEAGIKNDLSGGYHLPFTGRDMKYLERKNGSELVIGFSGEGIVMPELTLSADYREESFSDYDEEINSSKGTFLRSRDAGSYFSTRVRIPVSLKDIPLFKNVRQFQLNYLRGISLNEEGVPYEGENKGFFSEEYGFSRVMSEVSGNAFNLMGNYPGKFFTGRGNFAGGRDMVYYTMNRGVETSSESADYNNSLKLVDDISFDFAMDTGLFDLSVNSGLNQICERSNIYGIPNQVITLSSGFSLRFDLMNLFSFGFFRGNSAGLPHHSSSLDLGFSFADRMFITSNIDEKTLSPESGIIFRWDRSSLSFSAALDYRIKKDREFINYGTSPEGRDYIYISNMPEQASFSEKDYGYRFSTIYETDVAWVYDYFSMLYKLTALPVFTFEYNMALNRYDYFNSVSPEPYDLFMIKSALTFDLHKNIRGGVGGALSLERFRNRDDQGISREVFSYEISGNITILF